MSHKRKSALSYRAFASLKASLLRKSVVTNNAQNNNEKLKVQLRINNNNHKKAAKRKTLFQSFCMRNLIDFMALFRLLARVRLAFKVAHVLQFAFI